MVAKAFDVESVGVVDVDRVIPSVIWFRAVKCAVAYTDDGGVWVGLAQKLEFVERCRDVKWREFLSFVELADDFVVDDAVVHEIFARRDDTQADIRDVLVVLDQMLAVKNLANVRAGVGKLLKFERNFARLPCRVKGAD
jgi:hypothetical protein